jgi:hypothetical protein
MMHIHVNVVIMDSQTCPNETHKNKTTNSCWLKATIGKVSYSQDSYRHVLNPVSLFQEPTRGMHYLLKFVLVKPCHRLNIVFKKYLLKKWHNFVRWAPARCCESILHTSLSTGRLDSLAVKCILDVSLTRSSFSISDMFQFQYFWHVTVSVCYLYSVQHVVSVLVFLPFLFSLCLLR